MFLGKWLITLMLTVFCQNWNIRGIDKCQYGALADNSTQTLVVTVSAEPGIGQDLIRDLIKSSQNATLRATDSKGTPLRALDDENKGPAPLGLKRKAKLEPSPHADPPEGKRCPGGKPPATKPPQNDNVTADVTADPTKDVVVADKVEACNAQCSDQEGVEETVNICDEGCEAASEAKTEAKALKEFDAVVDGGTDAAAEAAKDGEEIKKAEAACRPCKKANPCGEIEKVEGDAGAGEGTCPVVDAKPPESTCPAADGDVEPGTKICSAEGAKKDPCGLTESKKGADPCRPADAKEPPADPAVDPVTGEAINVEVKVVEEPQCRISLEEETQVNADCRSCSARVLPGGGVKLSCFQCEHRPSDQTCYFARKVGVDHYGYPFLDGDRGFCPAVSMYSNMTCELGDVCLLQYE